MADTQVKIIITAGIEGLQSGLSQATAQVRAAAASMNSSLQGMSTSSSGLRSSFNTASSSISTSMNQISATTEAMGARSSGAMRSLGSEINVANSAAQSASSSIRSSIGGMASGLVGPLAIAAAAMMGLNKAFEIAKASALLAARVETLGVVLGVVGRNAGYSKDAMLMFANGVQKMGITTQESYQSLIRMAQAQIDLNQATKLARIAQDAAVIGNTNSSDAFARMVRGIQVGEVEILKTIGLNVVFEQSYRALAAQIGKNVADLTEKEKVQARVNVVTEAGVRIEGSYEAAMGTAGKMLNSTARFAEEASLKLGQVFQPALRLAVERYTEALKGLGEALRTNTPQMQALGDIIKGIATAMEVTLVGMQQMAYRMISLFQGMGLAAYGAGAAYANAMRGDLAGAWDVLSTNIKKAFDVIADGSRKAEESSRQSIQNLKKMWAAGGASFPSLNYSAIPYKAPKDEAPAGKGTKPAAAAAAVKEAPSRMADWEAELKEREVAEQRYFGFSIDEEKAFWTQKIALARTGTAEYRAVQNKINDLIMKGGREQINANLEDLRQQMRDTTKSWDARKATASEYTAWMARLYGEGTAEHRRAVQEELELARNADTQQRQITQANIDAEIAANEKASQARQRDLQFRVQMGQITAEQESAALIKSEEDRYAKEQELLERLKVLWAQYPVEYNKQANRLTQSSGQHNETIEAQTRKATLDMRQKWTGIMQPILGSFKTAAAGIINGSMSMRTALLTVADAIGNAFIDMFVKMAEKAIMNWLFEKLALTVTKKSEAITAITANAGIAASGAAASQAAIPIVGPALAAAAAATTYAMTMAYLPMALASAEGGWDVDRGGLTMIHNKEMVLPADLAGGVRDMVRGGGSASPAGSVGDTHVHLNVQAWDSKDVAHFLKKHGSSVAASLRGPARNFQFSAMKRKG